MRESKERRKMLLHFILCLFSLPLTSRAMNNISKPGCPTKCGNVTVPYPFGIGKHTGCSLDGDLFYVTCNSSYNPPKLFLQSGNIHVFNISDSELRIQTQVSYTCYNEFGRVMDDYRNSWVYGLNSLTFSQKNKFTVLGCDDYAFFKGTFITDFYPSSKGRSIRDFSSGCVGLCSKVQDVPDGQCSGMACCQTSIPKGLTHYEVELHSFKNHTKVSSFNLCGYAFLGEEDSFEFHGVRDFSNATVYSNMIRSTVPIVLDWVIAPNSTCKEATECQGNSSCYGVNGGGYRCRCNDGYEGNPYLDPGCQDIDECKDQKKYVCYGECTNTLGSYNCNCRKGYIGDARSKNGCRRVRVRKISKFWIPMFGVGIVIGIGVLIFTLWLFKEVPRWKDKKRREKFFERNGGSVLQPKKPSGGGTVDHQTKIFPEIEIEKATEQFTKERIIGQGPNGIVYKGMLRDARIVAIKKLKWVDESQVETFINVVLALSKIIHENVVKLLGCCLETEVPMLVYEYINNGTLFHFIHDENYEIPQLLLRTMWETRLQIATEIAGALAYLHSVSSTRIYHRDIKSSNILLDDKFRAKLSDFGISKSVSEDQTHVSTSDPECDQSRDVYSFGIVLLELLTGKIFRKDSGENTDLEAFILSMKDDQQVVENVDDRVKEAPKEQLIALAGLAKRCLNSNGKLRPNMKDVETELEGMTKSKSKNKSKSG